MTLRALTYEDRLPGVAVELAPDRVRTDPLRTDIAGLVGFAERGPLNLPVMVEDIDQYRAIFGGDVFIARSEGRPVYAQLPRAVQAFFDNGGRRCYVVRVAGPKASANRFRLPGLVGWTPSDGLKAVVCPAASEGRWSDSVRVATRLHTRALLVDQPWNEETARWFDGAWARFKLRVPSARTVQPGDLIAVSFQDAAQTRLFARVESIEQMGVPNAEYTGQRSLPVTVRCSPSQMAAFATQRALPARERLRAVDFLGERNGQTEWHTLDPHKLRAISEPEPSEGRTGYTFEFRGTAQALQDLEAVLTACSEGRLRLEYVDGMVLLLPVNVIRLAPKTRPPGLFFECPSLHFSREALRTFERLTDSGWSSARLKPPSSDLHFSPAAQDAPYLLRLPVDDLPLEEDDILRLTYANGQAFLFNVVGIDLGYEGGTPYLRVSGGALWEEVRFLSDDGEIVWPEVTQATPHTVVLHTFDLLIREGRENHEAWRGLTFGPTNRTETRPWQDVLAQPVEARTASVMVGDLLRRSTRLAAPPTAGDPAVLFFPLDMNTRRLLPEMYALPLLPDDDHPAAHDGLDAPNQPELFVDPRFILPGSDPVMSLLPDDVRAKANDLFFFAGERPRGLHSLFMVDEVSLVAAPDLGHRLIGCRAPVWDDVPAPVNCRDRAEFGDCPPPVQPRRSSFALRQLALLRDPASDPELDLYQRLAALLEMERTFAPCETIDEVLLVHQAMLHMAAARGDMLAVLSLPFRFGYWDVLDWYRRLVDDYAQPDSLSYGAAFHGWTVTREETTPQLDPLRTIPPDGTVCGMIAARDLARGPGVAPANVALRGVVGLDAPYDGSPELVELFNRGINVIQQRPGQFLTLSAHTLGLQSPFHQIGVRRMVSFLRRLVRHEGQRFVFETNNERFRRAVQVHFERLFDRLLRGGSLLAYHVDTGESLNPSYDVDQGRFVIAIQVAFSTPVEYITIILLRTGETLLEVLER